MKFSRHARNRMRHIKITPAEVEAIIADPVDTDTDVDGNPRFYGHHDGTFVRIVQPAGEPDYVKSVHRRGRLP